MKARIVIALTAAMLQGCAGFQSASDFRLPEGDPVAGQQAFWYLRCHACHDVRGVVTPSDTVDAIDIRVTLGGEASRIRTYEALVTAIINPSHELAASYPEEDVAIQGRSLMDSAYINHVMTVQELIDIVAWLRPVYKVMPPRHDPYDNYD